ncbi:MAG TPA: MarP family serine protease [Acidimicrobiales bacterium]|nr:MarP family serine protease [Acidimicrobiales bacterium]
MLDVVLVLAAVGAAVGGYRLGFVARATSWAGLALGVTVGALALPPLLRQVRGSSDVTIALVAIAALVGSALLGQALGLVLGTRLHVALPHGPVRRVDKAVGALLGIVGLLVALWLLLPTLADVPGVTSEQARGSVIARKVNALFPEAPDTLQALRRLVGDNPFPQVFEALRPSPDPGVVPRASGLSDSLAATVAASIVKIEGEACSRIQEGSGFFVADDLVVTNAHVVAGEDDSDVILADGSRLDGTVVAFDPARDLAVLRTSGADRAPLRLDRAEVGTSGGVFGHPRGGPLEISPFEVGEEITAVGTDIYDSSRSERDVLVLAADLAPGDSGGALVDPRGQVVGVAFAIAPDRPSVAYALAVDEVTAVLSGDLSRERDTGNCLV